MDTPSDAARLELLTGLPVTDERIDVAGVPTAVLTAGKGPPVVLLHGPGEFAAMWLRVLPGLAAHYRVVAPDLPGHGASSVAAPLPAAEVLRWLGTLIDATCPSPPTLIGRIAGGAVAARFAVAHSDQVRALVLVDTLGLAPFAPQPRFANALNRWLAAPGQLTYERFMQLCAYDLERVEEGLGPKWAPLREYAIELTRTYAARAAMDALIGEFGHQPLEASDLGRIAVPTTLIWGRHDMATPVAVAEAASQRHGWPLHVIEDAADDPPFESPGTFLEIVGPLLAEDQPARAAPSF